MKKIAPVLVYFMALACAIIVTTLVLLPYGKSKIKENALVKASNEVKIVLNEESDFNKITAYIEADAERRHFLGVTLLKLAENENMYAPDFESRYPRYRIYRNMVRDFASTDYSEWVASVIAGSIETEFEANVFEYLSTLKDRRYLNEAAGRFVKILNNSSSTGFAAQTSRDAFITGALSLYIIQFPGDNAVLRNALGGKVDQFIGLSEKTLTEIRGIPLNQAYIYLYLKYFGLEELINKKMEIFLKTGTGGWDRRTWPMSAVNSLINYFSSAGKGMSQNFYSLIRTGFEKDDSVRIYIALQVLKRIGFDDPDPSYNNLLNRVSRRESGLEIITETSFGRSARSTREIIFVNEVAELRQSIVGKQDTPFEETLNNALKTSSQDGSFIVPSVSAMGVIKKEISETGGQYTNEYIVEKIGSSGILVKKRKMR